MKPVSSRIHNLGLAALFAVFPTSQVVAQHGEEIPQNQAQQIAFESPYDQSGRTIEPRADEYHVLDIDQATRLLAPSRAIPTKPRMIAEWEPVQGALIRYPLGISVEAVRIIASELKTYVLCSSAKQSAATTAFRNGGVNMSNIVFVTATTDTYWTRDYGPWWITSLENGKRVVRMLDLGYFPGGARPNDDRVPPVLANALNLPTFFSVNYFCQGGNIMTDSRHVGASTDRVYLDNQNMSYSQIQDIGQTYMGFNPYYIMTDPAYPDEPIRHIDCWSKFIAPNKVLVKRVPTSDPHYSKFEEAANTWANQTDADGHPYQVFRVNGAFDTPYANHVILNDRVLVPIQTSETDPADRTALDMIQTAYGSSYRVIGVKAAPGLPWLGTDSIHCRVNSIPVFSGLFDQEDTVDGDSAIYNEMEDNGSFSAPNDVPDTAMKVTGTIGSSTDKDFFRVLVGAGTTLKVDMTGPIGKDYDLYLYNSSGTQLTKSVGSTATESLSYQNTGSTAVYYTIYVMGYNGAFSTTAPYTLILSR